MNAMIELSPAEATRTYRFPGGETVVLKDVTHFLNRPTNHRLKTADGKLHIVPTGWIHVEIDAKEWTL
jgi:hypothetical protein